MIFLDWLREKLGYHVCREFTRWETRTEQGVIAHTRGGVIVSEVPYSELVQVRGCTICGKIYRSKVE